MKALLASLLAAALISAALRAEPVTLGWDANPTEEQVVSYTLVYGRAGEAMDKLVTVTGTSTTVDVGRGEWGFAVFATNDDGVESDLCPFIYHKVLRTKPSTPTKLHVPRLPIEGSNDKIKWKNVAMIPLPLTPAGKGRFRFYRVGEPLLAKR
ncbi:MAG: hypothetical protein V4819_19130 [Verrucomicrobiota bacterium]